MSMVNVSLVGNLARSPEQICFAGGKTKTVLLIAVNSISQRNAQKKTDSPDFYRVEIWGKLAELAQKYLNKGNQVGVSGRLIMEHWTDRQGNERLTPVVSATQLSFPPRMSTVRDAESGKTASPVSSRAGEESEVVRAGSPYEADDEDEPDDSDELIDDNLFAGARAVSVAEPPPHYYFGSSPYRTHRAAVARV